MPICQPELRAAETQTMGFQRETGAGRTIAASGGFLSLIFDTRHAISFYSLLRYIASYQTFEEFNSVSAAMHTEYYNSCAVDELSEYYKRI